ncbi:MAG: UDPGP type 1 family protein [Clostridia bacterium]|nr:UDPGP type 1 family protein [Clostridia bacterium]
MDIGKIRDILASYGQLHLLDYYDELDEAGKRELELSVLNTDFTVLENISHDEKRPLGSLSPADALSLNQIAQRKAEFEEAGIEALKAGKVAAVLLAGGQGTRLGISSPKGTFDIGVTKELTIFECQINALKAVAQIAGAYAHLFIMTSTVNDGETRAFFKQKNYFGYPEEKIHFYVQKTAPAISFDGKVLLEEKYRVALIPNGNGGWYNSLKNSPCGKIIESEGVEWLNVYGVDNVLQKPCDPVFIGATVKSGAACSGKVVRKVAPEEKVGVLCKQDGLPAIVEYYEMPEDKATETNPDGSLKYCYGVILNYLFNVKKLDGIAKSALPYHLAHKKISCIENGKKVTPEAPNGYKPETLAVDLVKLMGSCLGFEVERRREFAPVKNMHGVDSVDTARDLLTLNNYTL